MGTNNQPVSFPVSDRYGLPETVKKIDVLGKVIYLVGTAHVSKQSVEDVKQTILKVEPDTVCVELCQSRYENLTDPDRWGKMDIVKVIRGGKAMLLLSSLIMTSFQRQIGKKLGVTPGAEMMEGVNMAKEIGAELVLADRDVQTTLKRTWAHLSLWSKFKMLFQMLGGLFVSKEDIDEETVEELKKEQHLTDAMQMVGESFPNVKKYLIDERDTYLAQKIREVKGNRVVAIVGAGHVSGIIKDIKRDHDLSQFREIPPPSILPRILKWAIPILIVGLIAYGFIVGGAEKSMESIYIWIGVNGALSALGAALAIGHPLTILSAFIAAPLTSINPMIAAGWVSGLVQAWVKKPTVKDLNDLPDDILTLRGFWLNPVSRILLVASLSNLGSMFGTFIAGSWIAAKIIGN
ncbi:MAG: conjugal transfer protein TraB [Candidatus Cloacimonetes bacterium 4572_55]|nr:MAG: conjugal transfer protein TraB [Candidatus Cloacimonetes bacterium 4572_55]